MRRQGEKSFLIQKKEKLPIKIEMALIFTESFIHTLQAYKSKKFM